MSGADARKALAALVCGVVFGAGLTVSQMVNPDKVIAFLDVTGAWDPSLALVMASALTVAGLTQRLVTRRSAPIFDTSFRLTSRRDIDRHLLVGSALFGMGWGLVGLCPGPALALLGYLDAKAVAFVAAMVAGAAFHRFQLRGGRAATTEPASPHSGQ